MRDFEARKFYAYKGPNFYLNRPALVFNLYLDPDGPHASHFEERIHRALPSMAGKKAEHVIDLFCETLIHVLKCEVDAYISQYAVSEDGDEYVVAVEYLDEKVAKKAVYLVCDWFKAMDDDRDFDFDGEYAKLQKQFDRSLYGGPTIYSLIEAGVKRNIPVFYLFEENEFQWGYGRKNVRGRSTTFSTCGIKDTEFTMYKDMVKDFLLMCGFPTPVGKNCFAEEEIVAEAEKLGEPEGGKFKYKVVVKPVAGHKGQGVVTGIDDVAGVIKAFNAVLEADKAHGKEFEGAIVETQIYGTDHRLLAVKGKFVAALERVPAYVDGNGKDTIQKLIEVDNATEVRADTARSPLCKIKIDEDLLDFLTKQGKNLNDVPAAGERVTLRRVANISAGGVSINVTDKIHPKNIKMVEDIAGFFNMTCLGIDVLTKDISRPWDEDKSAFGIIEINAGPGVFMHLAPAIGGSVDVPGHIILSHFGGRAEAARIPILMGNKLSLEFCEGLRQAVAEIKPDFGFGSLTDEGIYFGGHFFHKNEDHDQNVKIMLRNPRMDFLALQHTKDDLLDYGTFHQGADIVILHKADETETVLERDLLPGGWLIKVESGRVVLSKDGQELDALALDEGADLNAALVKLVKPLLPELVERYA